MDRQTLLMHVINSLGDTLDLPSARAITQNLMDTEAISLQAGDLLLSAIGDRALQRVAPACRNTLRCDIFKEILIHLV